jgi:hypothetical protein
MENPKSNVIPLRTNGALFTPSTKKKLEEGIRTLTDKPAEVVDTFEQVLCTQIILAVRALVVSVFSRLGEKTGRAIVGK